MDALKNFAYSTVKTTPAPPATGLNLTVNAGEGANFPAAPFNAVVWPSSLLPIGTNAEIVRVTGIVGDALTIVRQQEGSNARNILTGDQIAAAITAKTLTDIIAALGNQVFADVAGAQPPLPGVVTGQLAFNSGTNEAFFWNGAWVQFIVP